MDNNTKLDIINSFCGTDEHGLSKGRVTVLLEIWKKEERETINQLVIDSSVLNVFATSGYVHVDISFASNKDIDLIYLNKTLNDFVKDYNLTETDVPMITFIFQPYSIIDEISPEDYCAALNPLIWCLTSEAPDVLPNVFKVVFDEDNFAFCKIEEN